MSALVRRRVLNNALSLSTIVHYDYSNGTSAAGLPHNFGARSLTPLSIREGHHDRTP